MVSLTPYALDARRLEATVARSGAGAILTFAGVGRDHFEGRAVLALEYEAFPEMAIPELARICAEIAQRWPEVRSAILHRTGRVDVGEASVLIAVSAPHRADAYDASRFAIEALKARVPIWKREIYADGAAWKENRL